MKLWVTPVVCLLLLSACGYVGETRPPSLQLPTPIRDLTAVERGSKIVIQFTPPTKTTDGLDLKEKPRLVAYLDNQATEITDGHAELDAQPFYGKTARVAVKAFNEKHRDGGFSNVIAMPVLPAVPVPANLKAKAVADGVELSWESQAKQFTVFRQAPDEKTLTKLADSTGSPYVDKATEYGKQYRYAVQAILQGAESEIATAEPIVPVDTFAPAVPVALAAVVSTQSVELVWDRSTESDLAGYRIYRDAGTGQFERIGQSADAPSFSDKTIEKGKRYRYAVTAIDKNGNESVLSEPTEVAIP